MAEELPSREILEQIVERLDHLESLLQSNTARLHAIERRMAIEPLLPVRQRRPPHKPRAGENGETRAPQVEAPDADEIGLPARAEVEAPDAETATRVPPSAAQAGEPQSNEPQPHTWSLPSHSTEAQTPDTPSWMNESQAPRASAPDEMAAREATATGGHRAG